MNDPPAFHKTVLVFGSQALTFDQESFHELRADITSSPRLSWVPQCISQLADDFDGLCVEIPQLRSVDGRGAIQSLDTWLTTGSLEGMSTSTRLPNITLTPLCVISQLAAYDRYTSYGNALFAESPKAKGSSLANAETFKTVEIVGFCTGLLAALVVSLTADQAEIKPYAATAVRLAMLVGAIVDADHLQSGGYKSFSAAWKTEEEFKNLEEIISETLGAYISVRFDKNRVTVTAPQDDLPELLKRVTAAGIIAMEIGLWGRFHTDSHRDVLETLNRILDSNSSLQLPHASQLLLSCRADTAHTGEYITTGNLSRVVLAAMLVEPSQWWNTYGSFCSPMHEPATIVTIGSERCTPPSLLRSLPSRFQLVHFADLKDSLFGGETSPNGDDGVAVIGMSCKVAGADDLNEFWEILRKGESQHTEVPRSRINFETAFREFDREKTWYGNFIRDHDAFDNRFFKKTAREAASMDPQQRLLLQVAYQAVEQSGYFQRPKPSLDVGCYIGTCAVDYDFNIGCHAPNAFSSTGNLRGFIAGKVSHYFGWTGPGLTLDTACSGAAVAIHQACKAILSGECEEALAGGVNLMTQPLAYQNLAAATFLSPSGQCKPFCENADGYCRGEGIGAVFLKKMSAAVADGDQIFGIISATAVSQNQNDTPIFIPNAPSLSTLFEKVLAQAHLEPQKISYVEAHGTGTPVGDPAEYESIARVFSDSKRPKALQLGSVKGLVGHTESTSGVISLIKVLLMMHENFIPPQASFRTISPRINTVDSIEISTALKPWNETSKVALINNYGASGSNASMVVTQPAKRRPSVPQRAAQPQYPHPFWFSALDDKALEVYFQRLKRFLEIETRNGSSISISDLSFNLSRHSNRQLNRNLLLSCTTVYELKEKLSKELKPALKPPTRPVVLCFGGQVSRFVCLDREVYFHAVVLRTHLDQCDSVVQELGFGSIFPEIFQRTPIDDIVTLQLSLFAVQYASARSWMDCGVNPVALVGHSFGELTALCVSGILSLHDALMMIAGRAQVIRDEWGPETGSMLAVEADLDQVERLLALAHSYAPGTQPATIACFNGPRSFTLAGSTASIDAVQHAISSNETYSSMRSKRLNVTNAFHSILVERLKPSLQRISRDLKFHRPDIPVEFSTETEYTGTLGCDFVADHLRNPVYFHHAVQRLSTKYPDCLWLEAGSNSTVTAIAHRALCSTSATTTASSWRFQPVNITSDKSMTQLTSATIGLWNEGINVAFWPHHSSQKHRYAPVLLPPYQFEKSRHWMDLKVSAKALVQVPRDEKPHSLWCFERYQDANQHSARFRIRTKDERYQALVSSHKIARTAPICPATLEVDMAIEALMSLRPEFKSDKLQPKILGVENQAPLCLDPSRVVLMDLTAVDSKPQAFREWDWRIVSQVPEKDSTTTVHVAGKIVLSPPDDVQDEFEFSRYERLVSHQRCLDVLNSNAAADDIVQGYNIYRIFSDVVEYGEPYQGLKRLVGRRATSESAGRVEKRYSGDTWLDAHLSDCFSQVGGIWVNCMTEQSPGDMFIANGFEKWMRSGKLRSGDPRPDTWHVLASHARRGPNAYVTDIFIFDPRQGQLVEVILGINYARVSKLSMSKLLSRLTPGANSHNQFTAALTVQDSTTVAAHGEIEPIPVASVKRDRTSDRRTEVVSKLRLILAELSGLDPGDIKSDAELADLGIDSLVGMELAHDINNAFDCHIASDVLMEVLTFHNLSQCVQQTLGLETDSDSADDAPEPSAESSDYTLSSSTTRTLEVPGPHLLHDTTTNGAEKTLRPPLVNGVNGLNGVNSVNGKHTDRREEEVEHVLELSPSIILEAFTESKALTDQFIRDRKCDHYMETVMPAQTQLCVALALEAFKQLGCNLWIANPGQEIARINHIPSLQRLADYLYNMLEKETGIIELRDGQITRTSVQAPMATSSEIVQTLLREFPEHYFPHKLTQFAGSSLSDVLSGKSDGIQAIFGSDEGRRLASGLYADSPLNLISYRQMEDFFKRLVSRLPAGGQPLRVLELGAGTGGTTKWIVATLASLDIPVEYIFTDLAPSFVTAARKKYSKAYPFMTFRTFDIEKQPPHDLLGSQHVVLASNAVHATHSLTRSLGNIRKTLRSDGFLMMVEMTTPLYWVDVIFGLLEGWWLFDDGRQHAVAHQSRWENDLRSVGFGRVDWSDGQQPETMIQRVLIALNAHKDEDKNDTTALMEMMPRQLMVDAYVKKYTEGFTALSSSPRRMRSKNSCILVTGATGSLGSHIVAHLSRLSQVRTVICLNRRSTSDPTTRQLDALRSRGITNANTSKFEVIETDSSKSRMGLKNELYTALASRVTDIIHNAWPMSGKRPLKGFEVQFRVMCNLLDLASRAASVQGSVLGFQFVSSIAVVGSYPTLTGNPTVPEERMTTTKAVLFNGYGDAKWVCERMLDETLHRHPQQFRPMAVRLGQVAGSRTSGYWNHMEHFSFLVKSAQSVGAFPRFNGVLSWTPVDDVAGALSDLLLQDRSSSYPIYHIDNPVRQPWSEMVHVLAEELGVETVPFDEWLRRVRNYPGPAEWDNPAAKLIDFFENDYDRMSCGGLLLDTTRSCEHSATLRAVRPVEADDARKYVLAWRRTGFLRA